jgi:tRNA(Ile)-lysidine synthase
LNEWRNGSTVGLEAYRERLNGPYVEEGTGSERTFAIVADGSFVDWGGERRARRQCRRMATSVFLVSGPDPPQGVVGEERGDVSRMKEDPFQPRVQDRVLATMRATMRRHGMIRRQDTVVVGVSGGVDSMCLLDLLWRIHEREALVLVVAHLHHGLRGEEADGDFRWVEEQVSRYGLPFVGYKMKPAAYPGRSNVQSRARDLRYAFYEEVAQSWKAQKIATGHHRDDQVETLIMQMFRGTGSLRGMQPVRGTKYIRPLIDLSRDEILHYAEGRGIGFCEDSSNRSNSYLRNRIRRELIPVVREHVNPSFERVLIQFSTIRRDEADCLDVLARRGLASARKPSVPPVEMRLDRKTLQELEPALRRRVIRFAYEEVQGSTAGLSFPRVQEICSCLEFPYGVGQRRFPLHGGVHLFLEYEEVLLSREDIWACRPYRYPLAVGEVLSVPEAGAEIHTRLVFREGAIPKVSCEDVSAWLDWDEIPHEVVVRNVRPGARFRPLGRCREEKMKDFFIEEKVPRSQRVRLPLMEVDGVIAWVAGRKIGERFSPSERTRLLLEVRVVWNNRWISAGS